MAHRKVIKLKQWDSEYWHLTVMVTNNPNILPAGVEVSSPEEALKMIESWLKRAWTLEPRWHQRQKEQQCKTSSVEQSSHSEKPMDPSPKSYEQRKEQWESATGSAPGVTLPSPKPARKRNAKPSSE